MSSYPKDDSRSIADGNTVLEPRAIDKQLRRILSSPDFKATPRQKKFLLFVVDITLEGRADEIKGYTIATSVFGRKETFDQATDPIVSVEARRLRRGLEHYYLVAGMQDPVRIDIPKGSYVPTFHLQAELESACAPIETELDNGGIVDTWPSVLIQPFQNLSEDTGPNLIEEGFTTELAIELARYQDIRVLMKPSGEKGRFTKEPDTRFLIDGSVRHGLHRLKVAVHLFDRKTSRQIWADVYNCDLMTADLIAFQEEVAQIIAAMIAQEQGYITKTLSLESRNKPPSEMKTYEALLKFYKHDATFTPETLHDALEALEQAAITEPECSQVWTFLGRLYSENYGLETIERETPIEKAIQFAEKGVQLDPSNQRARAGLAFARLLNGQLPEGLVEAKKALALNPNSLIFLDVIGHVLSLLGDWDNGAALIRKAIKLNPYHRPYACQVLCADWLRQKEYEKAYMETLNFRAPSLIWDPLLRATSLGHLARSEEGNRAVEAILNLKADFQARGRLLIQRFIKSEELAECMIEGLKKSGLDLK
jgi:adenylate cyclase